MLKQQTILEVKKDERVYQMQCAPESPLGELYDALNQMRGYVINRILEEQKQQHQEEEAVEVAVE
jgi:hypothetical protein